MSSTPAILARNITAVLGESLEASRVVFLNGARQRTWAKEDVELHHFRDRAGAEIDLVLETRDGRVAAVEVKAGRSVGKRDLRALTMLRDRVGREFVNGVVLGCADRVQPLGDRLTLMPLSALWS